MAMIKLKDPADMATVVYLESSHLKIGLYARFLIGLHRVLIGLYKRDIWSFQAIALCS